MGIVCFQVVEDSGYLYGKSLNVVVLRECLSNLLYHLCFSKDRFARLVSEDEKEVLSDVFSIVVVGFSQNLDLFVLNLLLNHLTFSQRIFVLCDII